MGSAAAFPSIMAFFYCIFYCIAAARHLVTVTAFCLCQDRMGFAENAETLQRRSTLKCQLVICHPSLEEHHLVQKEAPNKVLNHFTGVWGYLGPSVLEPLTLTA